MDYREILDNISARDKKALEQLYLQYGQRFYSYAIHKWQLDTELAWQVVYDTLDILLLRLPDYEIQSQAHFDNLIFKIFINCLRQAFRKHRKNQYDIEYVDFTQQDAGDADDNGNEDEYSEPVDHNGALIDDHSFNRIYGTDIAENPKLTELKKILDEMDETERNILLLRAQNYSYEEISKMLLIESKNLKVKYLRAKNKVRKLFQNAQTDKNATEKNTDRKS